MSTETTTPPSQPVAPEIVTLCGSMRFFPQMLEAAADLTAQGCIVLAPFSVVQAEDQGSDLKVMLDRLHFQKIDMSSRIVVVTDQNGYVGTSTRREMAYAIGAGKGMDVREFKVPGDRGIGAGHSAGVRDSAEMVPDAARAQASAMTPEMFGGRDVDGIPLQILGDDGECFAALGHLDGAAFAAAAWKTHLELLGHDSDLDPFEAGDVLHRWAALEPAFEGAPDDEWSFRWVDEKTAGAFQVTTIDVSAL